MGKESAADERRPWANLPSDLRNLIFSYLFAFDCIRFRLTCKEWRFAIKVNPINIPRSTSSGYFPWLMFSSKQPTQGVFDFFHPISNETYTMHIPELANLETIVGRELNLEFTPAFCTPVFYEGAFYQLDVNGRLLTFFPDEDEADTAEWKDLLKPTRRNVTYRNSYIALYDDELVSVFVGDNGDPIEIFKMDWNVEEWVKVESLGNRTMFINETGSLLVTAPKTNGLENKIYFPKFRNIQLGDSRKIPSHLGEHNNVSVFYSLDTHKYHASGTEFFNENWDGIDDLQDCVWIEEM